jgi:hypothetical protein
MGKGRAGPQNVGLCRGVERLKPKVAKPYGRPQPGIAGFRSESEANLVFSPIDLEIARDRLPAMPRRETIPRVADRAYAPTLPIPPLRGRR